MRWIATLTLALSVALTACLPKDPEETGTEPTGTTETDSPTDTDPGTETGLDTETEDTQPVDNDGDGSPLGEDCNDVDATVYPGADEICNGKDDDCDGLVDDEDDVVVAGQASYWPDLDEDGYGDAAEDPVLACDQPSGTVEDGTDCDDAVFEVNPGAVEVCNGVDDDCDALVDGDDDSIDEASYTSYWPDVDGDGYGEPKGAVVLACEAPDDTAPDASDCDDLDPLINPGATEVCNGIDDDCDALVDDADKDVDPGTLVDWYRDQDGDGYGAPASVVASCSQPTGYVLDNTDCNDLSVYLNPGQNEVCNGIDDNCDLLVDDADPLIDPATQTDWYVDVDMDGYGDVLATSTLLCVAPSGTVADNTDCDDAVAEVNPAALEVCNGIDDDCDFLPDDFDPSVDPSGFTNWFPDVDGDGFGARTGSVATCDAPSGTVADNTDCDDALVDVFPGAVEVCNGIDDDCDRAVDDDDASVDPATFTDWYPDIDGDGFGNPLAPPTSSCEPVGPRVADATDCNDNASAVNPGATEVCNGGVDDNCDELADDADPAVDASTYTDFWPDGDEDGFGDIGATPVASCAPTGTDVPNGTDCDDLVFEVNPDAREVCNELDDNCDGLVDDDDPEVAPASFSSWYPDVDGDGFGDDSAAAHRACLPDAGEVADRTDCDDAVAAVNPDALEVCNGGVDDDCSGAADDADPTVDPSGFSPFYVDVDGDDYGNALATPALRCAARPNEVADNTDCDDAVTAVNPGATEVCNGFDDNCDALVDDADPAVDASTFTDYWPDVDGDGFGDQSAAAAPSCDPIGPSATNGDDCDDALAAVNPDALEICNGGVDDDCSGTADDADAGVDASTKTDWYPDVDGDGYGAELGTPAARCAAPPNRVADNTDCDDALTAVNPGATEVCNSGVDDNCDGLADDADLGVDPTTLTDYWPDVDGDGFGDEFAPSEALCAEPADSATNGDDCDDAVTAINPDATEVCNGGVDDDCSGAADDADAGVDVATMTTWYTDLDGDGFGDDLDAGTMACAALTGEVDISGDCDDAVATTFPGAPELCNGGDDDDCDPATDDSGTVSAVSGATGEWTSLNDVFAAGTDGAPAVVTVDEDTDLYMCDGSWFASVGVTGGLVNIYGVGAVELDGGGARSPLSVSGASTELMVDGLALTGGVAHLDAADRVSLRGGGGLHCEDALGVQLFNMDIFGNSAQNVGGGVYIEDCFVEMTDSLVHDNQALAVGVGSVGGGGGVAVGGGLLSLVNTDIYENIGIVGGGLAAVGLDVSFPGVVLPVEVFIDGGSIADNTSSTLGGGMVLGQGAAVECSHTDILVNGAADGGAAYFGSEASLSSLGCDFGVDGGPDDNTPDDIQGAVQTELGDGEWVTCTLAGCVSEVVDLSALVYGDLVITEIMQDPSIVLDADGEWFELLNLSGVPVLLDGIEVSDAGSDFVVVSTTHVVGPGEFALFAVSADPAVNGGIVPDVVYPYGDMVMANGDDEVVVGYDGLVIDQVYYDGGVVFPDGSGRAMSLDPSAFDAVDNDDGAQWCFVSEYYDANNRGTPGALNPLCF
jgi:hypothetical protein